jgi:hypothetical protein
MKPFLGRKLIILILDVSFKHELDYIMLHFLRNAWRLLLVGSVLCLLYNPDDGSDIFVSKFELCTNSEEFIHTSDLFYA